MANCMLFIRSLGARYVVLGRVTLLCNHDMYDTIGGSNWNLRIVRYELMLDDLVTAGRSLKWQGHQRPEVRLLFHLSCGCGLGGLCGGLCGGLYGGGWHMRMK